MKLKKLINRFLSLLLCIVLVSIIFFDSSVQASDSKSNISEDSTDEAILSTLNAKKNMIFQFLLSKVGIITSSGIDFSDLVIGSDDIEINRRAGSGDSSTGSSSGGGSDITERPSGGFDIAFKRPFIKKVVEKVKDEGKQSENGGYELVKTVPVNKILTAHFNTSAEYSTMYALLRDSGGTMVIHNSGGHMYYYKVDSKCYFVKRGTISYDGNKYYRITAMKDLYTSPFSYGGYYLKSSDTVVSSWEDTENLIVEKNSISNFAPYDFYLARYNNGINPFEFCPIIISLTGVSIPVFNSIDDAVKHSVEHCFYYTTSDYTGEGEEITIDYDELDKILDGYYDKLYDMLQQLIDQNGGNSLTPEQLQKLADQVIKAMKDGFDDIGDDIEDNSNILTGLKKSFEEGIKDVKDLLSDIKKLLSDIKKDFLSDIKELLEDIKESLSDTLEQVEKIRHWSIADTVLDAISADLLHDLKEFAEDFTNDTQNSVITLANGFLDTVNYMSKKFPFSIPWDICTCLARFAYAPETPYFEIPIVLEAHGINEKLIIDFSDFEIISKISRSALSILYAMGLIKFTNKVVFTKKGAVL